ncbi:SRPBCC family protein [Micromonospora sp. WMMD1082]|uniref:type II toxin-antitoxin system RatA family toxin n=1 Tax=Micromonospora sp. WMMD1082 TaxID=3016104 RepID=UPI002415B5BD|nr:SRPBCC family protein [Micromonospora sp. WMMD1082]MDG4794542.1 SRPBCC family protein [Micromonospora sp. WMMD1082]
MPSAHAALEIFDADVKQVWNVVTDFPNYPSVMPDVLEVTVRRQDHALAFSTWRTLLDGIEMTWEERDVFEPYRRIVFEQTEGDLQEFRGHWLLTETPAGVLIELTVHFDLGIPSLAPVLDPLGVHAIESNSRRMLAGLQRLCGALERAS